MQKRKRLRPKTPDVSMETGAKRYLDSNEEYLWHLARSTCSATSPAPLAGTSKCDGANVSGHVASQIKALPFPHGIRVMPSGCLQSERYKPLGSKWDGTLEEASER